MIFFLIFLIFFQSVKKLSKSFFSIFQKLLKQTPKITFLGLFKHNQVQSQEFWWSQPLPCRDSKAFYGNPGHNGPHSCEIGLKLFQNI